MGDTAVVWAQHAPRDQSLLLVPRVVRPGRYRLVLGLVLLVAAVVRLAALGSIPGSLSHDEAVKGYDAWSVLRTGRDQYGERLPLVFRAIGDSREALMPYLIALSEAVFGPTDFAVRLPAALAGIALVAGTSLLGAELFGRRVGLLAAAFLAVSPWHVQVSRLAFRAGLLPVCITVGLWLLLRGLRHGRSLMPAGLVLGLSLHTYLAARAFLPLLLVGVLVIFQADLRSRWRASLTAAFVLAAVITPLLLWGATHRADFVGHTSESFGWREAGGLLPFAREVGRKYLTYFGPGNLLLQGDPYPVPSTGRFGVLYWPEVPLFLTGMAVLVWRRQPGDRLVLWWLLTFPLAPALSDGQPPDWLRSAMGLPVFELVTALGGVALWQLLMRDDGPDGASLDGGGASVVPVASVRQRAAPLIAGAFGLALAVNGGVFLYDYAERFPDRAAGAFHDGIAEAVRALAVLEPGYERVVLPSTIPAVHDFYLFYTHYDPRQLQAEGLDDAAPPGAWADVRGFGTHRVCDPRVCCGAGAICLVKGRDPALPPPVQSVRDRTGRIAYTIVAGTGPE